MVVGTEITPLMTVKDVARILHVHINTVRRWSNQGIIQAYRVGPRGDRRFKREEIIAYLEDQSIKN